MIHIKLFKFHITLVNNYISKHDLTTCLLILSYSLSKPALSAFLNKLRSTLGAPDFNPSFASRNTDLLPAGRTLVNMMCLHLLKTILRPCKEVLYFIFLFQIKIILLLPLVIISRQKPEIHINNQYNRKDIGKRYPEKG